MNNNNISSTVTDGVDVTVVDWRRALLMVLLACACIVTICGNLLVVLAVVRKRYLQTPTGYIIVSLAGADLLVGTVVMPINSVYEITHHYWVFRDLVLCDLWHSIDILASTASIWNLCVIALDRYIANGDPIGYPERMSPRRTLFAITVVWSLSSCLSFPAILWWRHSSPELYHSDEQCEFTNDPFYVVFSSLVSFFIPLSIILYCYIRVFNIASRHTMAMRNGAISSKSNKGRKGGCNKEDKDEVPMLRVHYGGRGAKKTDHKFDLASRATIKRVRQNREMSTEKRVMWGELSRMGEGEEEPATPPQRSLRRAIKCQSRRMVKLVREQRAAQTLSIVVGCFIICWTPFFVVNILIVTCNDCFTAPENLFTVLTWLGHLNSMLNPLIYSRFSRDFRRAFVEVLTRKERRPTMKHGLSSAIQAPLSVAMGQIAAMYGMTPDTNDGEEEEEEDPEQVVILV